ncbi:MAG TPA: dihydrolipoamide acetyltransferase family protein [Acidimicrobiales bacterium]|nr:dihydrolipoamide acetyltransferase family protein [Acidimicrobiales bacterium]
MTMPQLGETVTEGTITKWLKTIGDQVERDEPLFEVSTDKVDSEVPSPAGGVLTQILVEEGDTVDVGTRLAVIGDSDAGSSNGSEAPAAASTPAPPATAEVSAPPPPAAAPAAAPAPAPPPTAPPPAPAPPTPPPPVPTAPVEAAATAPRAGDGLVLSPVVRKLLSEHNIDAGSVTGTGIGGRITRDDVEAVIASGGATAPPGAVAAPARAPAAAAPAAPPRATAVPVPRGDGQDEILPFTNIRRRTAEHMVRSKATSAHTLMVKEVDYERVERVRRSHGPRFKTEEGFSLTYLAFAARATVEALGDFPHLNASVGDDALIIHHDINLGIAVDLDNEGLIVPVVHHAEELTLRGMARRIHDVADRARTKRLNADDISGGTFSITNAGPFGTLLTGAIINQPQVAILSTDGVSRKPVVVVLPDGSESIAIHSVGLAAMTFDHRAVDGAYVARFLARLSEILNERDWAGEL